MHVLIFRYMGINHQHIPFLNISRTVGNKGASLSFYHDNQFLSGHIQVLNLSAHPFVFFLDEHLFQVNILVAPIVLCRNDQIVPAF